MEEDGSCMVVGFSIDVSFDTGLLFELLSVYSGESPLSVPGPDSVPELRLNGDFAKESEPGGFLFCTCGILCSSREGRDEGE